MSDRNFELVKSEYINVTSSRTSQLVRLVWQHIYTTLSHPDSYAGWNSVMEIAYILEQTRIQILLSLLAGCSTAKNYLCEPQTPHLKNGATVIIPQIT